MIEYRGPQKPGETKQAFEKRDDAHMARVKANEAKLLAARKKFEVKK
ncbi:MAG: hypothetical protein U0990_12645 [Candidatus Nanopelagicales bacterium]|nr:hypothetical protein [Candidatus Nanopelagicales bacterium]